MPRSRAIEAFQQGTYGQSGEKLDFSYYDCAKLDYTTPVLAHRLFVTPVGQSGGGFTNKTLDITNMKSAGIIPQGQHHTVRFLKVMYSPAAVKATAALVAFYRAMASIVVEVVLSNKDQIGQWTLQELMGAATLFPVTPTTPGDNIGQIQPRYHGIFPLNDPIILAAQTTFEVRVTCFTAGLTTLDGDYLRVALAGTLRRLS